MSTFGNDDDGGRGVRLPRVGRASLREQVARILEERILDGSFEPGARLPTESELTKSLNVSRTVVRDALRLLEARGLVNVRRGKGTTVCVTSVDAYASAVATMLLRSELTIGDVFAARAALEGQLALVAARNHGAGEAEGMVRAFARFEATVQTGEDVGSTIRRHVEFHAALLRGTTLTALDLLITPIQEMMLATSVVARGDDPRDPVSWRLDAHRRLLEAVLSRDESAVEAASADHWAPALASPEYESIRRMRLGQMSTSPSDLMAVPSRVVSSR